MPAREKSNTIAKNPFKMGVLTAREQTLISDE